MVRVDVKKVSPLLLQVFLSIYFSVISGMWKGGFLLLWQMEH